MTCGKKGYPTKREAQEMRNLRLHRSGRLGRVRRGKSKVLRIYNCPDCGRYHLTSKP